MAETYLEHATKRRDRDARRRAAFEANVDPNQPVLSASQPSLRDDLAGLLGKGLGAVGFPGGERGGFQYAKNSVMPVAEMTGLGAVTAAADAAQSQSGEDLQLAALNFLPGPNMPGRGMVPDDPASVTAKGKNPEWFHGVGGGPKLQRPFSEMTSTSSNTGLLTPSRSFNPEDFQIGGTLVPLYGDKTKAGETLTHVNDVELPRPQELQGGGRFMQEHPGSIWASEKGAITGMANKVRRLGNEGPVYGVHTAMGPEGGDFARMTTRPLLDMANRGEGIAPDAVSAFDSRMQSATGGKWPGLSMAGDDWLTSAAGSDRAALAKAMQLAEFQKAGFPDVGSLRKAITEPELMNRPMLTSGMTAGEFDPFGRVVADPARQHDTYNTQIAGNYLGDIGAIPPEIMWPDVMAAKAGNQLPQIGKAFQMGGVTQPVTPQWQDRIMTYLQGHQR